MAVDAKPKGATPPSDKEWISRALASMPDPAIAPRPAPPPPSFAPASRVANDDRQSIGELLRGLQLRPARRGHLIAAIISLNWIVAGIIGGLVYLPELQTTVLHGPAAVPVLLGLGALLVVPVSFFFMLAHMSGRAKELRLVTESMASLALRLAEPHAAAQQAINQVSDTLRREVNAMTLAVDHALMRAGDLETRVNGQVAALERAHRDAETYARELSEHLTEQHEHISEQSAQVRGAVEAGRDYSEKATGSVQAFLQNIDARVDAKVNELSQSLEDALTRFQQAVESRSSEVDDSLGARAQAMMASVNESGRDLAAALDRRIKDATVVLDSRAAEIEELLGAKIDLLDGTLQHRLVSIAQTLDARVANLEDIAAGRAFEAATQIEIHAKATADSLDSHLGQLTQSIKINAAEASGLVEQRSKAASDLLLGRLEQIVQAIEGRAGEARSSLSKLADDIERRIMAAAVTAGNAIGDETGASEGKLAALSANITTALSENAQYVERTLLGASAEAARSFVGQADHIAAALRGNAAEMTQLLDTKSSGLLLAVQQRSQEFAAEVTRATEQAVSLLDTQGASFARSVTENGGRISGEIAAASQAATEALGRCVRESEQAAINAIEHSKQTTSASVAEMREVHSLMRTESIGMFERLREANVLLREALHNSQESMSTLEKKLGKKLAELVATMKTVSTRSGTVTAELQSHIGSFQDSALKVLDDLSQLAAQFESHGHSLVQTVDLIDNINQRTVDTVNSRGAVLDTLVTTLDSRASDFEQRLMRFSHILDESLESATARTRDIGLLVAEASSNGVRAIAEQYELVRSTVDQENHRTADMMRSVYQATVGEAQNTLQQSAERFTELLQGIKRMASDMQRELEVTREELRRGVLDIPRETADSMTQMRQVIIDQVEALTELHRIVAKHGRSPGVAETHRPLPDAPVAEPSRAERPRRDAPPPRLPPVAPRADNPGQRGSWLTDLLHRASRNSEPGPAGKGDDRYAIDSLDSLSADIARMIDHDSVAELWDRYNRGERNVFSRRLYTPQGQRAFDEIRARYKTDRDFKHTVDRYMSEFERLIEDVSRDDRGQTMMRTYLTSETGKVYTMLAHAAGRFD